MTFTGYLKTNTALTLAAALLAGCAPMSMAPTASAAPAAEAGQTELLWLGQASFRIKSPGGKIIVVDPWITGGTKTPAPYKTDLTALGKDVLTRYRDMEKKTDNAIASDLKVWLTAAR